MEKRLILEDDVDVIKSEIPFRRVAILIIFPFPKPSKKKPIEPVCLWSTQPHTRPLKARLVGLSKFQIKTGPANRCPTIRIVIIFGGNAGRNDWDWDFKNALKFKPNETNARLSSEVALGRGDTSYLNVFEYTVWMDKTRWLTRSFNLKHVTIISGYVTVRNKMEFKINFQWNISFRSTKEYKFNQSYDQV